MAKVRALLGDVVVAETTADKIVHVESNAYFPPDAIKSQYFKPSDLTTVCGWKGMAKYMNVNDGKGTEKKNAVWYYPEPKPAAENIKGFYAFYRSHITLEE